MVIVREYTHRTDGCSTNKNESYRIVRDRIKKYWKEHNGTVLSTKKVRQGENTYCNYIVRIEY